MQFEFIEVGLGVAMVLMGVGVSALYFTVIRSGNEGYDRRYKKGFSDGVASTTKANT